MQVGIFAKTFPGTNPLTVLRAAKAAGFDCVQYNMACSGLASMPGEISEDVVRDIRNAVAETGVEIVALSATYNMIHPELSVRENGLSSLGILADAARALSIPLLTLCTGTRDTQDQWRAHPDNDTLESWRDLLSEMAKALQIADGLELGVEPELANVINSAIKARTLLDEMQTDRLRIVFDPANLFETPEEQQRIVAEGLELLGPAIAIVHAKDRTADGNFVAAGSGVLDYRKFFSKLNASGFDGPVITHGLAEHEAAGVATFLLGQLGSV
jgi:sugar phosphate isomerase/epimerase